MQLLSLRIDWQTHTITGVAENCGQIVAGTVARDEWDEFMSGRQLYDAVHNNGGPAPNGKIIEDLMLWWLTSPHHTRRGV